MRKNACLCPSRQGFAIILVLATLGLLALLSITYIKLALIDRNIARNFMDNKRAKLITQSGVEYGLARIQEDPFGTGWQNLLSKSIKINGVDTNYTESSGSTYGENRDIFKVEARDCQSMINVNDGLRNDRVKDNTKRILNVLGDVVGIVALGDRIIDARPAQGYTNNQELFKAVSRDEFNVIKDLVTTHAWQDPDVANPVPLSDAVISAYPVKYNKGITGMDIYRYGRGIDAYNNQLASPLKYTDTTPATTEHAVYGLDELNPQWIEIVSRSPVNVNQAEEEVLTALFKDLKGFFAIETRFLTKIDLNYTWRHQYCISWQASRDYGPTTDFGPPSGPVVPHNIDEIGLLYSTETISAQLATNISRALKACREKSSVAIGPVTLDYTDAAGLWFRGPFKTWRQFNAFVDYLVEKGIIKDSRSIFIEYVLDGSVITPSFNTQNSNIALKLAHQAKADCLKANFNPNLHLNELNPDANLHLLVDKTDLIVNSTEFCLTAMGYFNIESEGLILKQVGADYVVIANSKIDTIVKLYDAYRETNQKQFLAGQITNLEIGPEPAIADEASARENEYSGYIALPTVKNPQFTNNVLRGNFTDKFSLDYHIDGLTQNLTDGNAPDKTEMGNPGPYRYNAKHRLARSWRQGDIIEPSSYAPCDLRIDGVYIERHAGLAYTISQNVLTNQGVFCYWIKPWFIPENTNNSRTFLTINKYIGANERDIMFFANFYVPPYRVESDLAGENNTPIYSSAAYYHENSFVFGYSTVDASGSPSGGYGMTTPCLSSHNPATKAVYLKQGQWTHILCRWDFVTKASELRINNITSGKILTYSYTLPNHPTASISSLDILGQTNRLRIGEQALLEGHLDKYRNWSIDSTIDEFYFFTGTDTTNASKLYTNSRYFVPATGQATFTSGEISLPQIKHQPNDSNIVNPLGLTLPSINNSEPKLRIIGLSWTWYPEMVEKDLNIKTGKYKGDYRGKAILKNYHDYEDTQSADTNILIPAFLYPKVKMKLTKNGVDLANEYKDDGFNNVDIGLTKTDQVKYKIIIDVPSDPLNTVLLYSPVFDDITIYYTQGIQFVSYHCE